MLTVNDLVNKDSRKFGRKIFGGLKSIWSSIECPKCWWIIMHRMILTHDQYNGKSKPYNTHTGDHLSFARNRAYAVCTDPVAINCYWAQGQFCAT